MKKSSKMWLVGGSVLLGVIILVSVGFFLGVFQSILFVGSTYFVGDGLVVTSNDCQGSLCFVSCDKKIYFNDFLIGSGVGSNCGNTKCFESNVYRLTEGDVGTRNIRVVHSNCVSALGGSVSGFTEGKSIIVKSSSVPVPPPTSTPVTPSCGVNQILQNNVCVPAPCKYSSLTPRCVNGNFETYSCYNKNVEVCGAGFSCDASFGCEFVPVKECSPGEIKCVSQVSYDICSAESTWNRGVFASSDVKCVNDELVPNTYEISCFKCVGESLVEDKIAKLISDGSGCPVGETLYKPVCKVDSVVNNSVVDDLVNDTTCDYACQQKLLDDVAFVPNADDNMLLKLDTKYLILTFLGAVLVIVLYVVFMKKGGKR